jgi:hypothetical protein
VVAVVDMVKNAPVAVDMVEVIVAVVTGIIVTDVVRNLNSR